MLVPFSVPQTQPDFNHPPNDLAPLRTYPFNSKPVSSASNFKAISAQLSPLTYSFWTFESINIMYKDATC